MRVRWFALCGVVAGVIVAEVPFLIAGASCNYPTTSLGDPTTTMCPADYIAASGSLIPAGVVAGGGMLLGLAVLVIGVRFALGFIKGRVS